MHLQEDKIWIARVLTNQSETGVSFCFTHETMRRDFIRELIYSINFKGVMTEEINMAEAEKRGLSIVRDEEE